MNKLKVVIDTNVWIKGLVFNNSNPYCAKIMNWVKNDNFILVFAQDTIGELMYMVKETCSWNRNVKEQDRLKIMQSLTKQFLYGLSINTSKTIAPSCEDPDDDMFIKCSIESEADYIIMDDNKSGMQNVKEVNAVNSKEFVNIYYDVLQQVASE